ncbi:MAG: hypothetical protein N2115_01005 [bacterium]|nr:hypothetical protein [bacterium]
MKNVMLITYCFPPDKNIGALRPRGLAKYLPHFGWNVFVITPLSLLPRDSMFNIIETYPTLRNQLGCLKRKQKLDFNRVSFKTPLHKRIFSGFLELIPFPDSKNGWILHGTYTGIRLLKEKRIDAIISIYSPASSHFIAHRIKKFFPCVKWIADFRDLWALNSMHTYVWPKNRLLEKLEKSVLRNADFLTTVSVPLALELEKLHKKQAFAIPNGFDHEEYDFTTNLDNKFSITYTGSLYPKERDPEILFIAVKRLLAEEISAHENIEVKFYGRFNNELDRLIKKHNLEKQVKQMGMVPREDILRKQKSSQILLLNLPEDRGVYTGKLFEYLGAKRPILAIGYKESVVRNILEETNAGIYCFEEQQIYRALKGWYTEWKINKMVTYTGREDRINFYTHRMMASRFAELLDRE